MLTIFNPNRLQELIIANERLKVQTVDRNSQFNNGNNIVEISQMDSSNNHHMEGRVRDSMNAKETELLHSRLRDIAQAIINDDQLFPDEKNGCVSPRSRYN